MRVSARVWRSIFGPFNTEEPDAVRFSEVVDATDVMRLPTVVAARQAVADLVSSFPLAAFDTATGQRIEETPTILRRPNPIEPLGDTLEKIVNGLTGSGNAWLAITALGSNGHPLAVETISETRVTYQLDATRSRILSIEVDGRPVTDWSRRMLHVPFVLDSTEPVIGQSPLCMIEDALYDLAAAHRFSASYYDAAQQTPPYVLKTPQRLQDGKADALLTSWVDARDRNRPAVISGGMELETFSPVSARDALVLDALGYLDATVARVMQMPPTILNTVANSSLTYSTQRDQYRAWLVLLQASYLKRIEAAFSRMLPRTMEARFDTTAITSLDTAEQLAFDIDAINAGILTVDEVRKNRGLAPLTAAERPNNELAS